MSHITCQYHSYITGLLWEVTKVIKAPISTQAKESDSLGYQGHIPQVEGGDVGSRQSILKLEFRIHSSSFKGIVCGDCQLQLIHTVQTPHSAQSAECRGSQFMYWVRKWMGKSSRGWVCTSRPTTDPLTTPYRVHRKGCTLITEQEKYDKVKSICFLTKIHQWTNIYQVPNLEQTSGESAKDGYQERSRDKFPTCSTLASHAQLRPRSRHFRQHAYTEQNVGTMTIHRKGTSLTLQGN